MELPGLHPVVFFSSESCSRFDLAPRASHHGFGVVGILQLVTESLTDTTQDYYRILTDTSLHMLGVRRKRAVTGVCQWSSVNSIRATRSTLNGDFIRVSRR